MRIPRSPVLAVFAAPLLLAQLDFSGCLPSGSGTGTGGGVFNVPPTVVLTADVTRGIAPLTVRFSSSGSTDDGLIVSRLWNFGDNQTSQDISPTHTFQSTGTYTVRLTLTDDLGASSTRSVQIAVTEEPVAVINVDRSSAASAPAVINFDGSDSHDPDGQIVQYVWDFGDGTREVIPVVAHTFATAGTFRVRLTVTDNTGVTSTSERFIEIGIPKPKISFRKPSSSVNNIVASADSLLWVYTTYTVQQGVPAMIRAGLDGDADPCEAQTAAFDPATGEVLYRAQGPDGPVRAVAVLPDGSGFLAASDDRATRLFRASDGALLETYPRATAPLTAIAVDPSGERFVQAATDGSVSQFTISDGNVDETFTGHTSSVNAVAYSSNGSRLLTGDSDAIGIVWNTDTGDQVQQLTGHAFAITSAAFSPSNPNLALTGSIDQTAKLWNIADGSVVRDFAPIFDGGDQVGGHSNVVTSVAFSPDGSQVLTGSDDRTAILWDVNSGDPIRTFSGHTDRVVSVGFSPDGAQIITGSGDGSARIWDAESGALVRTMRPCASTVSSVAFSPDGKTLFAGVAASNDIVLNTDPSSGGDLNLNLPTALSLAGVDNGEYRLWAEVNTDRTDPVRTYAAAKVNIVSAFTPSIDNFTPRAPLRDDAAEIIFPVSGQRQIVDIGPLREGDRVFLSRLDLPGYGETLDLENDDRILLLDSEQEVFLMFNGNFRENREGLNLIVGHNSSKYYIVSDGTPGVSFRVERGGETNPRQQRVLLHFNAAANLKVGISPTLNLGEFDASDINPMWGDAETAIIKDAILNTLEDLFADYDFVFATTDQGDPPLAPYLNAYFGGSDDGVETAIDYLDPRNSQLGGNILVYTDQNSPIGEFAQTLTAQQVGEAIARTAAYAIGLSVGLTFVTSDSDIMDPTSDFSDPTLGFDISPLNEILFDNGAIGIQDAPTYLREVVGPH